VLARGGPGAIFLQAQKLLCHNLTADPGSIPILSTYFLRPAAGQCPPPSALGAAGGDGSTSSPQRWTGARPCSCLRPDALGTSSCIQRAGSLPRWESYLRYEVDKISALPDTVVYPRSRLRARINRSRRGQRRRREKAPEHRRHMRLPSSGISVSAS